MPAPAVEIPVEQGGQAPSGIFKVQLGGSIDPFGQHCQDNLSDRSAAVKIS